MISQKQKMKTEQKLTPQQLLLMRLLQLPVTSLEQRIKEEVEKNPLLEVDESQSSGPTRDDNPEPAEAGDAADDDFHGIDIDEYYDDDDYSYREKLEKDHNAEKHTLELSDGISFTDFLSQQFHLRSLSERQRVLGDEIIGSIDESGYLGRDLSLIANDLAFRSGIDVSDTEIEEVLAIVQSLDPAGVGARNLRECLLLQLRRLPQDNADNALATKIVESQFDRLTNKHYNSLMSLLKCDEKQLKRALGVIRRMNPKPGWGHEEEHKGSAYIIPDFIVSRDGNGISCTVNDHIGRSLRLSTEYTDMMQQLSTRRSLSQSEKETLQFIKNKSDEAQWLLDTLELRNATMTGIMSSILDYQHDYFMTGNSDDLRPMRLKDIAMLCGYDESTISRVVNQKYVQTDFGTMLLKDLFSKAAVTDKGDIVAVDNIKRDLQAIVDNEDKSFPLTDEALTKSLKEKGYTLSRRTVTKYRESMGIPVGRLRKEMNN